MKNKKLVTESIDDDQLIDICETFKLTPNVVKFPGDEDGRYVIETHVFNSQNNRKIGLVELPLWFVEDLLQNMDETAIENVIPGKRKKRKKNSTPSILQAARYPIPLDTQTDKQSTHSIVTNTTDDKFSNDDTDDNGEVIDAGDAGNAAEGERDFSSNNPVYQKLIDRNKADEVIPEAEDPNIGTDEPENVVSEVDPVSILRDQIKKLRDDDDDEDVLNDSNKEVIVSNKENSSNSLYRKFLKTEADPIPGSVAQGPININNSTNNDIPPEAKRVAGDIATGPINKKSKKYSKLIKKEDTIKPEKKKPGIIGKLINILDAAINEDL